MRIGWRLLPVLACALPLSAGAGPSADEAARFLTQATFGPKASEIADVQRLGYAGWLAQQFQATPTLHRPQLQGAFGLGLTKPDQLQRQEVWWRAAVTAPDQLRQRVAFALSEIMVVSDNNGQLWNQPLLLAEYYDILVRNALGNYRQLLQEVTLSPAMGLYLSMIRNEKPDPQSGRRPDENFAREAMQLFSIGLWQLNPDGSDRLDGGGNRVPTYDQVTVEHYARAFTGWTWADAETWHDPGTSFAPMKAFDERHDTNAKTLLDGLQVPAGRSAAQDLASALDSMFRHPNAGPFIGRRLIQRLTTSNPSPAYVQRVAQVFADNGSRARGDLGAVVRAILLDPEARAAPGESTAGKLREPLLRVTALWRAFDAAAQNGKYAYPYPDGDLGQAALRAPSVFNFFQPDYRPPGAMAENGVFGPEFQIQTESQGMNIANALSHFVLGLYEGGPGANQQPGSIRIRIAREKALAADPAALVEHLDGLLLAGQMSSAQRQAVTEHVASVPAGDGTQRSVQAIFLVVASPEFAVQR